MPLKFQLDRFTLTPVKVRVKSDSKTDRLTLSLTHTHRRIVQNHISRRFEGCNFQIRSHLELDYLHDTNTSMGHGGKMPPSRSVDLYKLNFLSVKRDRALALVASFFVYWLSASQQPKLILISSAKPLQTKSSFWPVRAETCSWANVTTIKKSMPGIPLLRVINQIICLPEIG